VPILGTRLLIFEDENDGT